MIYNDQLNLSNYYGELKIKSKVTAVDKDIDIGDFHFEFLHLPDIQLFMLYHLKKLPCYFFRRCFV